MGDGQWIAALDSLPFSLVPERALSAFGIDGVVGFCSGQRLPEGNVVGQARLTGNNVDAAITRVAERFGMNPYLWTVGPLSTPEDLPQHLRNRGLREGPSLVGMVFDQRDAVAEGSPWTVERVSMEEALSHAARLALAYGMGMTPDSFEYVLRTVGESSPGSGIYLATDATTRTVVGYGVTVALGPQLVFLSGSATVPAFRGRGVYRAVVAARLRDAFAGGAEAALITAVSDTSAPICARMGFRACCTIQQWYGNLTI